jgi:hypothetical protein
MNAAEKKQYFTAAEANQRLPLVRVIVQDIVGLYKDVHERRERLNRISQSPGASKRDEETLYSEELRQTEEDLDKDIVRLDVFVDELRELGCELKDFHTGLIDFLTLVDGREAYLCWKLGEDDIAFWHELDAGFQGRQSLLEESVSGDEATEDEQ